MQRCCVHKLRNLERKAPKHALATIRDDFHRIVYAAGADAARTALRTTNVIERLHEEFRHRVKTQGALPSEDAALVLLFSLVASGQIKLRRIDGWRNIAAVVSQHPAVAA